MTTSPGKSQRSQMIKFSSKTTLCSVIFGFDLDRVNCFDHMIFYHLKCVRHGM